jgi:hypothetical protein
MKASTPISNILNQLKLAGQLNTAAPVLLLSYAQCVEKEGMLPASQPLVTHGSMSHVYFPNTLRENDRCYCLRLLVLTLVTTDAP